MADKPGMPAEVEALLVGRWSTGYDAANDKAILFLQFSGRAPLALAIPMDQVEPMATALANLKTDASKSRN